MKVCSIDGCEGPHYGRGWCNMHYARWRKNGDPNIQGTRRSVEARFWARVQKGPGCWDWMGASSNGYGCFYGGGKTHSTHRIAYELTIGPIPEGKILDHRCHNRLCANPSHLRLVTNKQNGENRIGPPSNNTTGVLGVTFNKTSGVYVAYVTHNLRRIHGGRFKTLEQAAEAARQLRLSVFSHNDADRRTE